MTASVVTPPSSGTLTAFVSGSGVATATYTPDAGFVGTDLIVYQVSDGEAASQGTVTIQVRNRVPTAAAVTAETAEGAPVLVTLTGADGDGDPLTFSVPSVPANGSVSDPSSTGPTSAELTYTPDPGFTGMDVFAYVASDGVDESAEATVTVSVTPGLTADPLTAETQEDVPLPLELTASNPRDAEVTFTVVAGPEHGVLEGPSGAPGTSFGAMATASFTYVPDPDFSGEDAFTFEASNGLDDPSRAEVSLTVTPVNDPPTFTRGPNQNVGVGSGPVVRTGWATEIDPGPGESFGAGAAFVVTHDQSSGFFAAAPQISLEGTLSYAVAAGETGSANVSVVLEDGEGASSVPQAFTIASVERNQAPTVTLGPDPVVAEGDPAQTLAGWATGISGGSGGEPFGPGAGFTLTNDNNALFDVQPALALDGTLTFTPAPLASGVAAVRVVLRDGFGAQTVANFMITVTGVNDPPSFTAGPDQTLEEDAGPQTVAGWATAIDPGPGETFGAGAGFTVTNDNNALFDVQPAVALDGTLTFTPASMATGVANVSVTLSDGDGATTPAQTFVITIAAINDAPSFTAGPDQTVVEDAGAQTVADWATDISPGPADEAGQTVSFNVSNDDNALFSAQPAISATGELTYTPADDASGSALVTVSLSDDGGTANGGADTSPDQTFTIDVTPVNDPPSFTVGADVAVALNAPAYTEAGWATAIDPGPGETFGAGAGFTVTNDNNALFTVQPAVALDGTLTFTPVAATGGVANVEVTLSDGDGEATAAQSFTITVNSPPEAVDQAVSTDEATPLVITLAGTDADGDALTFAIDVAPAEGSLGAITQLTPTTAQVTYTPTVGELAGQDFTFTVNDGTSTSDPGIVTLTVWDAPEPASVSGVGNTQIVTAGYAAAPTTPVVTRTDGVLATTPALTIQDPGTPIATTQGGSVTLEADGDFLYTPPAGFSGSDDFDYTVTTGSTATVTVTVNGTVWYVDNTTAGGGTGRSHEPFNTLAGASAASSAGEIIFVDRGDGTTTGMDQGIVLQSDQELLGEPAGLTVSGIEVVAAVTGGPRPQITQGTGTAVQMADGAVVREIDIPGAAGAGIEADGTTDGTVTDVDVTDAGGAGVDLGSTGGTFTLTGVDVENAVGSGFLLVGGAPDVTFTGTITNAAGRSVEINGRTGGTVTLSGSITDTGSGMLVQNNSGGTTVFSGASKSVQTATDPAVQLLNNAGHTVSFTNGGLDIDAASGTGLLASGGGTLTVEGSGNSVTTTSGSAVTMNGTQVGAAGITFESVSAVGGPSGIALTNITGSGGTFRVTGTGSTDGSGGTLEGSSGAAVALSAAADVSLANMILGDGTATAGQAPDGVNSVGGNGISVSNVDDVTLDNVFIARTGGSGIGGTGLSGATFTDVTILNAGDGNDEHGMAFDGIGANNLDGTVVLTDVVIDGAFNTGLFVQNSSGSLNLTIQGTSVAACRIANTTGATFGDDGMLLDARGSTSMTVTVDQCTFEDLESDGIGALAQEGGGASLDLTVSNSTFTGCAAGTCSATGSDNALSIRTAGSATLDFDVTGNQLGANNATVLVQGNNTSTLRGTVDGNTIGTGATDSGSRNGRGIDIFADDASVVTVEVSGNTVRNTDFEGIYGLANDGTGLSPTLNATILNNTVATPDDNSAFPLGVPGMEVSGRNQAVVCADIRGNDVAIGTDGGFPPAFSAIRIRQRDASTFSLERLTAGSQTAGTAETHVASENPLAASVTATADASYTGVADGTCPTPP